MNNIAEDILDTKHSIFKPIAELVLITLSDFQVYEDMDEVWYNKFCNTNKFIRKPFKEIDPLYIFIIMAYINYINVGVISRITNVYNKDIIRIIEEAHILKIINKYKLNEFHNNKVNEHRQNNNERKRKIIIFHKLRYHNNLISFLIKLHTQSYNALCNKYYKDGTLTKHKLNTRQINLIEYLRLNKITTDEFGYSVIQNPKSTTLLLQHINFPGIKKDEEIINELGIESDMLIRIRNYLKYDINYIC